MKKLLLLIALVVVWSCNEPLPEKVDPSKYVSVKPYNNPSFKVVTIDSCEYILYEGQRSTDYAGAWTSGLTHKGNCKYCQQRKITTTKGSLVRDSLRMDYDIFYKKVGYYAGKSAYFSGKANGLNARYDCSGDENDLKEADKCIKLAKKYLDSLKALK